MQTFSLGIFSFFSLLLGLPMFFLWKLALTPHEGIGWRIAAFVFTIAVAASLAHDIWAGFDYDYIASDTVALLTAAYAIRKYRFR